MKRNFWLLSYGPDNGGFVENKSLLEFGRSPIVKGRGLSIRVSLLDRVRAARGMKQAIVKVASYAHGKARVQGMVDYINRKGKLVLETESGERIQGREQGKALVANWSRDFDRGVKSRDAVHVVFSMPPGSNVGALRESVRKAGARAFSDQEWVFAIHEDTKHPHAHMIVKMRGREKDKKLRLNKPQLYRLREIFAEAAREQGVMLAASSRAARGVGQKGKRQAIYHMHRKGIVPKVEKQAAREILLELERGPLREKPWERAMRERNELERKSCLEESRQLRAQAADEKMRSDPKKQSILLSVAADLERFAKTTPKPKSRRQVMMENAKFKTLEKSKGRQGGNGLEL